MRPTELCFRSPKERTPGPNYPVTTHTGRPLFESPSQALTPTFSHEKRFAYYDQAARRTGMRVGPGSYNVERNSYSPGAVVYRPFHGQVNTSHNGYIMVGNQMQFEPGLLLPESRARNPVKDLTSRADPFYVLKGSTPKRGRTAVGKRGGGDSTSLTPSSRSQKREREEEEDEDAITPEKLFHQYKRRNSKQALKSLKLEERIDRLLSLKDSMG